MCKIKGHSFFTYLAQPWNAKKLRNSEQRAKALEKAKQDATNYYNKTIEGEETSQTASTAQFNKNKKNQNLSSLRVPLETKNVGASVGSMGYGLNLGGY